MKKRIINLVYLSSKKCKYKDCNHRKLHVKVGGCKRIHCRAPGTDHSVCIDVYKNQNNSW